MVGSLVVERISGRKHLQKLAGLQTKAYWIGNFIFDFIKLETLVIFDCVTLYLVGFKYKTAFYILPLAPLSIIPFCYSISFFFQSDNLAYLCTVLGAFFVNALLARENAYSREECWDEKKCNLADALEWLLYLVPNYIFSAVTYTEEQGVYLSLRRE